MSAFVKYILSFKNEDSAWGDVSKDFAHEQCEVKRGWGYKKVKTHLEEKGACDRVLVILDEMWEMFTSQRTERTETRRA